MSTALCFGTWRMHRDDVVMMQVGDPVKYANQVPVLPGRVLTVQPLRGSGVVNVRVQAATGDVYDLEAEDIPAWRGAMRVVLARGFL